MNGSSIWAIAALFVATAISIYTLFSEEQKLEVLPPRTRRWRKPVLSFLTVAAFVVGIVQIRKADREAHKANDDHTTEHTADQQQISGLRESVNTLTSVNQIQYERNRDELLKLQDRVNELKLAKLTQEDRKKIADLESQLDKALAPKPKANLKVGFYQPNLQRGQIVSTLDLPANDGVVKFSFLVSNISDTDASKVTVWIRACNECKLHREPPEAIKVPGALEIERIYHMDEVQLGVSVVEHDIEIEVPSWMTRMPVTFDYRCADCEVEKDWQDLWVNVTRAPK
jgi:hypothetical protein